MPAATTVVFIRAGASLRRLLLRFELLKTPRRNFPEGAVSVVQGGEEERSSLPLGPPAFLTIQQLLDLDARKMGKPFPCRVMS